MEIIYNKNVLNKIFNRIEMIFINIFLKFMKGVSKKVRIFLKVYERGFRKNEEG